MSDTSVVYVRINSKLKKEVDSILEELNVTPSALIQMLYGQIKLTRGIPFDIKMPAKKPIDVNDLTIEQLKEELMKGVKDVEEGKTYTMEEVDEMLRKEFGI